MCITHLNCLTLSLLQGGLSGLCRHAPFIFTVGSLTEKTQYESYAITNTSHSLGGFVRSAVLQHSINFGGYVRMVKVR